MMIMAMKTTTRTSCSHQIMMWIIFLALAAISTGTTCSAFVPSTKRNGGGTVTCSFASPWSRTKSTVIMSKRDRPPLFAVKPTSNNNHSTSSSSSNGTGTRFSFLLDPGTKGGVLFLSLILFLVPIIFYNIAISSPTFFGGGAGEDVDEIQAGIVIGVGFSAIVLLTWVASLVQRVINKDMTYTKQLKEYENAVLAKRLEELDEDELQALQDDLERNN